MIHFSANIAFNLQIFRLRLGGENRGNYIKHFPTPDPRLMCILINISSSKNLTNLKQDFWRTDALKSLKTEIYMSLGNRLEFWINCT